MWLKAAIKLVMSKRIRPPIIQVFGFLTTADCDPVDLEENHPDNPRFRFSSTPAETENPFDYRSRSTDRPKVCDGCRNYCGESHGGNKVICRMHPYGAVGENCNDWRC